MKKKDKHFKPDPIGYFFDNTEYKDLTIMMAKTMAEIGTLYNIDTSDLEDACTDPEFKSAFRRMTSTLNLLRY
tara:strand:- start:164 stop:382 length:219 start_codon:yes stop_codon:yes gene_type:complete